MIKLPLLLVLFLGSPSAQFLSRSYYPFWDEVYENYGREVYRDYPLRPERKVYDPLGIYLIKGIDLVRFEEFRTLAPFRSSSLVKMEDYGEVFDKLVIADESYMGWANVAMVGNAIRTRFTQCTLSLARFNGVRWDASSRKNRFSILGSRISNPQIGEMDPEMVEHFAPLFMEFFGTFMFGGRWEGTFGDVLELGTTFLNLHRADGLRRRGSIRGVVPSITPWIPVVYVVFSDDSPEDGGGAEVYDVQIFVNGVRRDDIKPEVRKIRDVVGLRKAFMTLRDIPHIRRDGPWLVNTLTYSYMFEQKKRSKDGGLFAKDGFDPGPQVPLRADGTDVLVFKYEIPSDAKTLRFRALVSGDYCIDVASGLSWAFTWEDWHNVARARGKPKGGSNLEWVSFEYGFPTGMSLYGADFRLRLGGFKIEGEYSNYEGYFQLPVPGGKRSTLKGGVYFLRALRTSPRLDLGLEVFRFLPGYTTSFPIWKDDRPGRAGVVNYELVDDNDDQDEWPDTWENWDPLDPHYNPEEPGLPWDAQMNLSPPARVGMGVYPGLDVDQDGRPDYSTSESIFLSYYVDPLGYVYGDDFNNNGVVDVREDDNKPDYPYDVDSQGGHLFLRFRPAEDIALRFGLYDVRRIAGCGRNFVGYGELGYTRRLRFGDLRFNYMVKRVMDDIPDDVYSIGRWWLVRHDPLDMKDSIVHIFFLDSHLNTIKDLNITNRLKFNLNLKRDGGRVTDVTWVSKADYTFKLGRVSIRPMLKYTFGRFKRTDPPRTEVGYSLLPLLRVDVPLARSSRLKFGLKGYPFPYMSRDPLHPAEDLDSRGYVIVFENRSKYLGYDVIFQIISERRMERRPGMGKVGERDYARYEVRVYAE